MGDPGPLGHPADRAGPVREQHLRLRPVRPGAVRDVGAVPHEVGAAGAGRRRTSEGRRHGRHRRVQGALPQRGAGRRHGRAGRVVPDPRVGGLVRSEHDRRPRVHRARRHDLRALEPGRGAGCRPAVRLRRVAPDQVGHPRHADPVAIPADGPIRGHAVRRRRVRRPVPGARRPTASRTSRTARSRCGRPPTRTGIDWETAPAPRPGR